MKEVVSYPVIDVEETGKNIQRLREERGLSVAEVRTFLGFRDPQAIYQWQRGISLPSVDHLCALSKLLGVTMEEILVLKEPENPKICKMERCTGSRVKKKLKYPLLLVA